MRNQIKPIVGLGVALVFVLPILFLSLSGRDLAEASHVDCTTQDIGVEIRKEAEGPDTRTIVSGSLVTFDITVSNPCDAGLTNIVVSDPLTPECNRNIPDLPGIYPNNPISSYTYQCTTTQGVITGFTNVARVDAEMANDASIPVRTSSDIDPSTVEIIDIDIRKQTEGPDSRTVSIGSDVSFEIVVTNTGEEDLTNVAVTDVLSPDCDGVIGDLSAGASVTYNCTAPGVTSGFTNVACVSGERNGVTASNCDPSTVVIHEIPTADGRFTGGGNVYLGDGTKVTRGLELHCDGRAPNNLQVNFHGSSDNFHLNNQAQLLAVQCFDFPNIAQDPPPNTPIDTLVGKGIGRLNNSDTAVVCFVLVDDGEPGNTDIMAVQVFSPSVTPDSVDCMPKNLNQTLPAGGGAFELLEHQASETLYVSGGIDRGNLQAHKDNK